MTDEPIPTGTTADGWNDKQTNTQAVFGKPSRQAPGWTWEILGVDREVGPPGAGRSVGPALNHHSLFVRTLPNWRMRSPRTSDSVLFPPLPDPPLASSPSLPTGSHSPCCSSLLPKHHHTDVPHSRDSLPQTRNVQAKLLKHSNSFLQCHCD